MEQMSGFDARFLLSETPAAHMHTLKVAVLDISGRTDLLTPPVLLDLLGSRLDRMPVLRRRVVMVPHDLGNPVVVDDPDFDLSNHVHHATLPSPGDQRQLDQLVARIASTPLRRDRPLWDLTVADGLADGHVAFVVKIHHALADGAAAVALLMNAFVSDDADAVVEPYRPEPVPSRRTLYGSATRQALGSVASLPGVAASTVSGLRRERSAKADASTPVLGPFAGPRTPFNVALTPDRTYATAALPIPAMAAVKASLQVSLNDVFLAACAGGVRRHLERLGELPSASLVASVPLATSTEPQRLAGNHVDNMFLPIHTDLSDPVRRTRAIHESVVAARRARQALGPDLLERRASIVPPAVYAATMRAAAAVGLSDRLRPPLNLVASGVRGPRQPLGLDGGVITALYSCGPILEGIGLNITAWTYLDTMYVSLLGCSRSLAEPWRLAEDITNELQELSDVA